MSKTNTRSEEARRAAHGSLELIEKLGRSTSDEATADAWHHFADEHADELHSKVLRARRIVHTGTPADAVAFANEDATERARAAVRAHRSASA
jgi:hypothetical protein